MHVFNMNERESRPCSSFPCHAQGVILLPHPCAWPQSPTEEARGRRSLQAAPESKALGETERFKDFQHPFAFLNSLTIILVYLNVRVHFSFKTSAQSSFDIWIFCFSPPLQWRHGQGTTWLSSRGVHSLPFHMISLRKEPHHIYCNLPAVSSNTTLSTFHHLAAIFPHYP